MEGEGGIGESADASGFGVDSSRRESALSLSRRESSLSTGDDGPFGRLRGASSSSNGFLSRPIRLKATGGSRKRPQPLHGTGGCAGPPSMEQTFSPFLAALLKAAWMVSKVGEASIAHPGAQCAIPSRHNQCVLWTSAG